MSGDAPTAESIRSQLADIEDALDAAETEADLDDVESRLAAVADALDALKATVEDDPDDEADDDDEAGIDIDALADDLDALEADLEDQRGPYVSDVEATLEEAADAVEDRDLTDQGLQTVQSAVADARVSLSLEVSPPEIDTAEETAIVSHIQALAAAAGERDLDPDADANRIASMLGTAESLIEAIEDAEVWSDLTVRQQLDRKGFYDSIEVDRDFPPELSAIKAWEDRGEAEPIRLALDAMDSDFMEEYCMEALGRLRDEAAIDALSSRANRRNETAIEALGRIGSPEAVDALTKHLDGSLALQTASLRALGQIGSADPLADIAERLRTDNPTQVRSMAARALGMIGDTRAIPVLNAALSEDEDPVVRGNAAWALAQIRTPDALATLAEHADDASPLVAEHAQRVRG